ncbi:MAG: LacI family DNA-binding transcriptional regulator [Chloroflexi bacterium]|nr:LacI family DNA-binding transcriptional regulator [Chloroflexota bacterium]
MKVSIKDIAKSAGVSHSTVSRALADSPLIAERTRARIHRLAQKRGYTPNAIARGLVTQHTRALGVVVTSIADPFVAEVVRGIEEIAADNGYRVFLGTSHDEPAREVNLVKALREWRVDGVIVASSRVGALYQPHLKEIGAPIVLINNQGQAGARAIHSIAMDDSAGGELATRYLIEQGHRVIAYLGGPADRASHRDRLNGYKRALRVAKIAFDPARVQTGNGKVEAGERVGELLARAKPTAIFCYNDITAIGALHALKQRGVRVPQDISLVGYDDILLASYVDPPLTTIHQPKDEMGRTAMRMLLDLLNGDQVANVRVTGKLIVRESTTTL